MRPSTAVLISLLCATDLRAQDFGSFRGRVADAAGRPVSGAPVHTDSLGPSSDMLRPACPDCEPTGGARLGPPAGAPAGVRGDTLAPAQWTRALASTASELLASRSPSVIVRGSSGTLGTGSRLYLRGVSAVNYRATPLVVVDGVRYTSDPGALLQTAGGQSPAGLDDLDPEEIEQVVVLPGPAAAAKYGPEGANGVLEVRTRRPAARALRVGGFLEAGLRADHGGYPSAWSRRGTDHRGEPILYCSLVQQAQNGCTPAPGSLGSVNHLAGGAGLRDGLHRRARVTAEGGAGWGGLRGTADVGSTDGVQESERWERRRLHLAALVQLVADVRVEATALHTTSTLDLPPGDNTALGYQFPALAFGPGDPVPPREWIAPVTQSAAHTMWSARVGWSARDWLDVALRGGVDRSDREDVWDVSPPPPDEPFRGEGAAERLRRTFGASATAFTLPFREAMAGTTVEVEHWTDRRRDLEVGRTPDGVSRRERSRGRESLAVSLSQTLDADGFGGQVLLRRDAVQPDDYGLWSGSVAGHAVPVGAPVGPVDRVRLRAGAGWVERPLPHDFEPQCEPFACEESEPVRGARTREMEGGVDVMALNGRLQLGFTGYRRVTAEPIWALNDESGRYTIRNAGVEARLSGEMVERRRLHWSAEVIGWTSRSRVTELDGSPILFHGGAQAIREGFPLGGFFARPIRVFEDRNGDGIIGDGVCPGPFCEVELEDEAVFLGPALPTRGVTVGSRLRIEGRVTVAARLEHQGGNLQLDRSALYQCAVLQSCRAALDPTTPFQEQAQVVAARRGSVVGFVENGSFTRLRELSVTLHAPRNLLRRTGARGAELVLAGRNLATWTGYRGLDPEVNFTGSADPLASGEFLTKPHPRVWTVRLEVNP